MAHVGVLLAEAVAVGVLAAPSTLRALGVARVVLRYAERLVTHAATFRALADLLSRHPEALIQGRTNKGKE